MPNVFEVLASDHEQVKRMLMEFEAGPTTAAGASENDLALRKKMAEHLVIEESKHEAAEEMYFWPAVRERVPGGDQLADKGHRPGAGSQGGPRQAGQAGRGQP